MTAPAQTTLESATMDEMVERVARAIAGTRGRDPDDTSGGPHPGGQWLDPGEPWWRGDIDAARAAIKAMREPTEAMLEMALDVSGQRVAAFTAERESGVAVECDLSEEDAADINDACKAQHHDTYCAMIDAALVPHEQATDEGSR